MNKALQETYAHDQQLFRAREDHAILAPAADAARFRANEVIAEALEPLAQRKVRGTVIRDRFISKTGGRWAPDSPELTQLGAEELAPSIDAVDKYAPKDKREESIIRRYTAAVNSANQALDAMQLLSAGYEINPSLGSFPEAAKIRSNPVVLQEMARFTSDLRSLDDLKWPDDDQQVAAIVDYLKNTTDKALEEAHRKVFDGRRSEYNFWAGQVKSADGHRTIKAMLSDPSKDLPIVRTRYSTESVNDEKLFALAEELKRQRLAAARVRPEILFEMPEDAQEINDLIWGDPTSQEAVRMRNLEDGSGSSSYMARLKILGMKGAGKAVPIVRSSRQKKPNRGHRAPDGPPEYVSREIREGFPPEET
jgi:hypothetical protein